MGGPNDKGHLRDAAAAPGAKTKIEHPEGDPDFRAPGYGNCVLLTFYYTNSNFGVASRYAKKAARMLGAHNIDLRIWPGIPGSPMRDLSFPYSRDMVDDDQDTIPKDLLAKAKAKGAPLENSLPVIFCTVDNDRQPGDAGKTFPSAKGGGSTAEPKDRYVLIYDNALNPTPDDCCLLHEIGHAAGLWHESWNENSGDHRYNFMASPGGYVYAHPTEPCLSNPEMAKDPQFFRNTMFKSAIDKILAAPFCVPKLGANPGAEKI